VAELASGRELLGDAGQPVDVRRPVGVGQVRDARRQPGRAVDALAQDVGVAGMTRGVGQDVRWR
jgi:hypothetical protein